MQNALRCVIVFCCACFISSSLAGQPHHVVLVSAQDWDPGAHAELQSERSLLAELVIPTRTLIDTVYFGGSGLGNGSVVRGGVWEWEADGGETPEYFPDGDPVGNQFLDGWRRLPISSTSYGGLLPWLSAGHWQPDGNYHFDDDTGSFAHRASFHQNDGIDDGPDPLDDPTRPEPSAWSIWIGTNLYLNPEHCWWEKTAGYGDAWSEGIAKVFAISAPTGTSVTIEFYHRYAVENSFDTNRIEISFDGVDWQPILGGIYTGGTRSGPLPTPIGGFESVELLNWPGGVGGGVETRESGVEAALLEFAATRRLVYFLPRARGRAFRFCAARSLASFSL